MSTKELKTFILRQIEDVWNNGHMDAIPDYWDEKLQGEIRESRSMLLEAFPDLQIMAEEMIAENDKVMARLRFRGTHLGSFMGIAPTGNKIEWNGVRIWRVAGNKVIETWAIRDRLEVRQKLGAIPQPTSN